MMYKQTYRVEGEDTEGNEEDNEEEDLDRERGEDIIDNVMLGLRSREIRDAAATHYALKGGC